MKSSASLNKCQLCHAELQEIELLPGEGVVKCKICNGLNDPKKFSDQKESIGIIELMFPSKSKLFFENAGYAAIEKRGTNKFVLIIFVLFFSVAGVINVILWQISFVLKIVLCIPIPFIVYSWAVSLKNKEKLLKYKI